MIKQFQNTQDYSQHTPSVLESEVAHIESTNEIKVNNVNVTVPQSAAKAGDAVFLDENKQLVFLRGGAALYKPLIPAAWEFVGECLERRPTGELPVRWKSNTDRKYLDVCQYAITAISSTSLTIKLRMSPDYAVDTTVSVTIPSTDINAATAQAISEAVAARAAEVGDTKAWWAYLADAEGNKVSEGGTQIIIQCDTCVDHRFNNVSATGCTIADISWDDMLASLSNMRKTGHVVYWAPCCYAKSISYYGGSGTADDGNGRKASALTEAVPLKHTDPVNKYAFFNSPHCALLREAYGTGDAGYEAYVRANGLLIGFRYGMQALPDALTLTNKYGNVKAPTKDGGEKYKYPALHWAASVGMAGNALTAAGRWHLEDHYDVYDYLNPPTLGLVNATAQRMGTSQINTSSNRWLAFRFNAYDAYYVSGAYGNLGYYYVYYSFTVEAVTLLPGK